MGSCLGCFLNPSKKAHLTIFRGRTQHGMTRVLKACCYFWEFECLLVEECNRNIGACDRALNPGRSNNLLAALHSSPKALQSPAGQRAPNQSKLQHGLRSALTFLYPPSPFCKAIDFATWEKFLFAHISNLNNLLFFRSRRPCVSPRGSKPTSCDIQRGTQTRIS